MISAFRLATDNGRIGSRTDRNAFDQFFIPPLCQNNASQLIKLSGYHRFKLSTTYVTMMNTNICFMFQYDKETKRSKINRKYFI